MNPQVDDYIAQSKMWPDEIAALRPILLGSGLTEEFQWRKPCYTSDGQNIVIVQEMKDFLALMFFKGALLKDATGVLVDQGPNSRSARRIEFTSVDDVKSRAGVVESYIAEAIAVERAGLRVDPPEELELVEELQDRLAQDPALEAAFESLTPGRRREYNLYFAGAKQSRTRSARIEKYAGKILERKGLRDR